MSEKRAEKEMLDYEATFIEVFSDLADIFGNPRSHGQIYGVLFASAKPLGMEEIARKLTISMGSVSMGLRALEEFSAVEKIGFDGGRGGATYRAMLEMRPLVKGFVSNRLLPKLQNSTKRLQNLQNAELSVPPEMQKEVELRIERVTKWHKQAEKILGEAERILGAIERIRRFID